jgi:hypothetical protein
VQQLQDEKEGANGGRSCADVWSSDDTRHVLLRGSTLLLRLCPHHLRIEIQSLGNPRADTHRHPDRFPHPGDAWASTRDELLPDPNLHMLTSTSQAFSSEITIHAVVTTPQRFPCICFGGRKS